jgi:hypothetical protein
MAPGFFIVHPAAVGERNRKLSESRGRGNSLYILFCYLGGTAGLAEARAKRAGGKGETKSLRS